MSDDLERLAELTGFDSKEMGESESLLSEEEAEEFDKEDSGWSSNPLLRLVVVGGGVGIAALGAAYLIGGFSPPKPQADQEEVPSAQTDEVQGDKSTALRKENAELKTKLALRNQEHLSDEVKNERPKDEPQPKTAPKPQAISPPRAVSPQPVRQMFPVRQTPPPPPPVVRPVVAQRPPASLPTRVPVPRTVPLPSPSVTPSESSPKESNDPTKELAKAQSLGSYGEGKVTPQKQSPAVSDSAQKRSTQSPLPAQRARESPREEQQPSVVAGSTAAATLETPVFENESFVATLTAPLGELPAGTKVLGRAARIDARSGVAKVTLAAVIKDGQEHPLPEGAVTLRGQEGEPLVAQSSPESRGSGGLGSVGRTIVNGVARGAIRDLTSDIDNDLVAGVLEEVSSEVLDGLRDKSRATQVSRREMWYLPKGLPVQLFVNRSFAVEGAIKKPEPSTAIEPQAPENTLPNVSLPLEQPSVPVAAGRNMSPPEVFAVPEFSPAFTPVEPQPVQPVPQEPRMIVDAPVVKVWAGSGMNISFLTARETITRAWLDDPSMATLDFDQPLCAAEAQGCTTGTPSVVHLRWIEGIEFAHLPSGSSTLLTVMTQTPAGEERLYAFRIERGTGSPEYHTVEVPPS